jgi:hypothetical protein
MKLNLDSLKEIKKVDAPEYLWTRIQQAVESSIDAKFSSKWSFALGVAVVCLLCLNSSVFFSNFNEGATEIDLVETLKLDSNNTLYNE